MTITWTIKIDDSLEKAVNQAINELGYMNKAEMIREAVREFLLRRGVFSLVGDTEKIPKIDEKPIKSLKKLLELAIPKDILETEINTAREEVESFVFPQKNK